MPRHDLRVVLLLLLGINLSFLLGSEPSGALALQDRAGVAPEVEMLGPSLHVFELFVVPMLPESGLARDLTFIRIMLLAIRQKIGTVDQSLCGSPAIKSSPRPGFGSND
jgi:hypothetical protein